MDKELYNCECDKPRPWKWVKSVCETCGGTIIN
jgi:hypothetical protein